MNNRLWQNYEQFGGARGEMVAHILSGRLDLRGARILDFGAGTGGVSLELARQGAEVTAVEPNPLKRASLLEQKGNLPLRVVDAIPNDRFQTVILLDVIEHLIDWSAWLERFHQCLSVGGFVYLSTPNKWSPLNILCDPHFSLPLVSLLNRRWVRRITADLLRWQPKQRIDFPQLLSLPELHQGARAAGFDLQLINREAAAFALGRPQALWNRALHLRIIDVCKRLGADRLLIELISDEIDFFNERLNPAWYALLVKKARRK